jgi:hypothetical protein
MVKVPKKFGKKKGPRILAKPRGSTEIMKTLQLNEAGDSPIILHNYIG